MMTRQDYLNECREPGSFARYYGEIIADAGGPDAFRTLIPVSADRIRAALAAGDAHLNTVPLALWDARSAAVKAITDRAPRARDDWPTLGNAVCILKEAARLLVAAEA